MTKLGIALPQDLLTRDDESELFAMIEAGTYAAELLRRGCTRRSVADLELVRDAGRRATQRVWLANLRLVAKIAQESARRYRLHVDDLFQEGCMAVIDAIMRFDRTRGHKFSTLAHTYITRRVIHTAQRRAGSIEGTANRTRHMARFRASFAAQARASMPSFRQVAQAAGMSLQTATRATMTLVDLEEATQKQTSEDGHYDCVETHGTDFLDLLGADGDLLKLRFGIGTRPHSRREIAALLNISVSSVARAEHRALERARALLEDDQCRMPGLGA